MRVEGSRCRVEGREFNVDMQIKIGWRMIRYNHTFPECVKVEEEAPGGRFRHLALEAVRGCRGEDRIHNIFMYIYINIYIYVYIYIIIYIYTFFYYIYIYVYISTDI